MISLLLPILVFTTAFERLNIFIPALDFSLKLSLIILPITGLFFLFKKRLVFNPTFLFPALAAVLGVELLSVFFSYNPFQSLQVLVFHLLMVGLFYLIVWSAKEERPLNWIVWAWGIAAAVVALLGIWQFFRYTLELDPTLFFENWFAAKTLPVDTFLQSLYGLVSWQTRWELGMIDHFLRPPSTFIDVSTGASFVGILLILGLGWFLSWKKEDRQRVLMGGLMAISSLYFLMTVSRSAALGLLLGVGTFAYLSLKDRINPRVLKTFIIAVALAVLGLGVAFSFNSRLSSTLNRLTYAQDAWQMFLSNPLTGVGAGNFEPYCREVIKPGSPACYSHSIFLTWLGEMGVLGVAANLFLAVVLIVFLYRLFDRLKRGNVWKWRIAGLLSAYIALLAANLFHAHYGLEFTWVLLGLAVSGFYLAKRSSELNPEGLESPTLRVDVLGIKVHNVTMAEAVERVKGFFASGRQAYVVTSNSEMVIAGRRDKEFTQILNQADLAVPDTVGLVWASRIWGTPLNGRVAGTDLLPRLCEEAARRGGRALLLEGPEGLMSASAAAEELRRRYPKIEVEVLVIGADQDDQAVVAIRNISRGRDFDLLFVAYGHGKQERWISRNLKRIPVKVAMGVGGALDFIAGKQIRAPKMMRSLGLEWLYRLIRQPRRIKRQLALLPFIFLTFKESFKRI